MERPVTPEMSDLRFYSTLLVMVVVGVFLFRKRNLLEKWRLLGFGYLKDFGLSDGVVRFCAVAFPVWIVILALIALFLRLTGIGK